MLCYSVSDAHASSTIKSCGQACLDMICLSYDGWHNFWDDRILVYRESRLCWKYCNYDGKNVAVPRLRWWSIPFFANHLSRIYYAQPLIGCWADEKTRINWWAGLDANGLGAWYTCCKHGTRNFLGRFWDVSTRASYLTFSAETEAMSKTLCTLELVSSRKART